MKRYWINQPSALQEDHNLHGVNVLCDLTNKKDIIKGVVTVYFTSGNIHSKRLKISSLSPGWRN